MLKLPIHTGRRFWFGRARLAAEVDSGHKFPAIDNCPYPQSLCQYVKQLAIIDHQSINPGLLFRLTQR